MSRCVEGLPDDWIQHLSLESRCVNILLLHNHESRKLQSSYLCTLRDDPGKLRATSRRPREVLGCLLLSASLFGASLGALGHLEAVCTQWSHTHGILWRDSRGRRYSGTPLCGILLSGRICLRLLDIKIQGGWIFCSRLSELLGE